MKTFQDFANGHKLLDHQPYFNPFSASPPNSLKWSAKLCCSSQDVDHASALSPQLYLSSNPSSYLHFPGSLKPQAVKLAGIPLLKTLICPSSSMLLVILLALSWWGISEKFLLTFQHCKEKTKTCFFLHPMGTLFFSFQYSDNWNYIICWVIICFQFVFYIRLTKLHEGRNEVSFSHHLFLKTSHRASNIKGTKK